MSGYPPQPWCRRSVRVGPHSSTSISLGRKPTSPSPASCTSRRAFPGEGNFPFSSAGFCLSSVVLDVIIPNSLFFDFWLVWCHLLCREVYCKFFLSSYYHNMMYLIHCLQFRWCVLHWAELQSRAVTYQKAFGFLHSRWGRVSLHQLWWPPGSHWGSGMQSLF